MSGTIIITKNSTTTSSPGQGNLNQGELAYSFVSQKLFIGDASTPVNDIIIGGKHFTDMLDHTLGTLTASSAILTDSSNKIDVINIDNITIDGNSITTTNGNGNLVISPNGTGSVDIQADVDIVGNLTVSLGTTMTSLDVDNINLDGNTISITNSNGDLTIQPNGTGIVSVNTDTGMVLPSGLVGTRPSAASIGDGAIRYNETTNRFEGTVSGSWTGLGGVVDIDQDTYIVAEENADDDTLRFYAAGTEEMKVEASGVTITDQITSPVATITTAGITTANIGTANVTTQLQVDADANFTAGIDVTAGDVDITADLNVGGNTIMTGNLTVNGTTTSVNSSITTLNDPVIKVGDGSAAAGDSNDRGVNLDWGNGTVVKTGFFGMDMQTERFSFKPDSSATAENYSTPWGDAQFGGIFLGTTGQMEVDGTGTMVSGTIDCGTF